MTSILLTGGTGTLGRQILPRLTAAGREVRVLSRTGGDVTGDLTTGAGVREALRGIHTVLHCAGSSKGDDGKARNLVEAAKGAGVRHIVYISVVGADRVPMRSGVDRMMFGYYGAKFAAEQLIEDSGIPWTTLRATQFHELTFTAVRAMGKLPVVPVPAGISFQPVDSGEVADRLVELTLADAPAGLVADFAGPKVYAMKDLVRGYLASVGKRRPLLSMRMPGRAARAMRDGANLNPARAVGKRTWEDFLASR